MNDIIVNCETGETGFHTPEHGERDENAAWKVLRAERNRRLTDSDWTVLSDTPTSTAAWKTYRQALRDLPSNTIDPFNPVWPTPPA